MSTPSAGHADGAPEGVADLRLGSAIEVGYCVSRTCPPDWWIPAERIEFVDLTYIVGGSGTYAIDGVVHRVGAGDLVCVQPGSTRRASTSADEPLTCYAMNLRLCSGALGPRSRLPLGPVTHVGLDDELLGHYRELWHAWVHQRDLDRLRIDGLALLALHRACTIATRHHARTWSDPRIEDAVRYVTDHFAESISVTDMADRAGLHPVYFADLFRQVTGHSPRRYITEVRIRHAESLLRNGQHRIRDVAAACGYQDAGYFSRHVRELTGHSPSELMRARPAPWPPPDAGT
ncbi:AraC family transcriptional regulator [Miniimonas arenae]|uniref:AraC family transcriptional regulator n=1 Tax=Miniimonas arenae TaxID=676201 RepID=UPI0028ADE5C9|nr:AraC family transcriptional regulator [Miniimonas arenae]